MDFSSITFSTTRGARQVERGLRQFFRANALAEGQFVAMPSKVVDTLWHEFILHTRAYESFCRRAAPPPVRTRTAC